MYGRLDVSTSVSPRHTGLKWIVKISNATWNAVPLSLCCLFLSLYRLQKFLGVMKNKNTVTHFNWLSLALTPQQCVINANTTESGGKKTQTHTSTMWLQAHRITHSQSDSARFDRLKLIIKLRILLGKFAKIHWQKKTANIQKLRTFIVVSCVNNLNWSCTLIQSSTAMQTERITKT